MQSQQKPDSVPEYKTFAEFWPFYLGEHSNPLNQKLHALGTTIGLGFLVATVVTGNLWFILPGFFSGYLFAWIGHFKVEHNRPATFKYPFFSLMGDFKMYWLFITGQLQSHIAQTVKTRTT